jgi:hypothetical protein
MAVAVSSEPQLVRGQDDDELEESVSQASRDEAVKNGDAFPDGSFPIRDQSEADKAWNLRGHDENHSEASIVAHIRKQVAKHGLTMPGDSPKPKVKPKKRKAARESLRLTVREVGKAGSAYEATIVREGPGNPSDRRYYTKQALQGLVSSGACEGLQCYANHPSASEERERPERDVRQLVGHFKEARYLEDGGVGKVRAKFVPISGPGYEWVSSLIESALAAPADRPLIGISIDGEGATEDGEVDGKRYHMVREVTHLGSADIVTKAGAGGQFHRRLQEAWRDVASGDLVLSAEQVRERGLGALGALVGAIEAEDDERVVSSVRDLREALTASVPKPARRRAKGDDKLRERLHRAEAEAEDASKRARLAVQLVSDTDIPTSTRSRWLETLLEKSDETAMREALERLRTERRDELAALRESLTPDYAVEGAGPRSPIVPAAPTGGGLLERLGLDRDELLEA